MKNVFLTLGAAVLLGLATGCSQSTTTTTETAAAPAPAGEVVEQPAAPAEAPADGIQTVTGTFVNLEWGDYLHFNMKTDAGEDLSLFVLQTPEDMLAPFEKPGMEGKKIEVKWRTSEQDIPEAGGKMEVDELIEVKAL